MRVSRGTRGPYDTVVYVGRFDSYPPPQIPAPTGNEPIRRLAASCELIDTEILVLDHIVSVEQSQQAIRASFKSLRQNHGRPKADTPSGQRSVDETQWGPS